ncbi:hypothetical protein CIK80_05735 [Psychrobacter sp. JB193]|nr:hypothetical protein CIK80_05735 [Psychrobacter sp. JB193]
MASSAGHTTDLEIYQAATYGNASIMMMLDNSGSMDSRSISEDYNVNGLTLTTFQGTLYCTRNGNIVSNPIRSDNLVQRLYDDAGNITSESKNYSVDYCLVNGSKYYDRMSRLKMALIPLFANPKSTNGFGTDVDLTKYKIGLGSFFFQSQSEGGGKIESPVLDLKLDNRKKLIDKVVGLRPETNTPIANAYAEAGAYMLGTRTYKVENETRYIEAGYYIENSNRYDLYECKGTSSDLNTAAGFKRYECNAGYTRRQNYVRFDDLNPSYYLGINNSDYRYDLSNGGYYYKKVTKDWTDYKGSGFERSVSESKFKPNELTYKSPVSSAATQCDGYGIYFLTDGVPNNADSNTLGLMNRSLAGGSTDMGTSCNSNLSDTNSASGWECSGEYAKKLYDKSNSKGVPIATATVGFGNVFKQLTAQGKVTKSITRPSGAVETVQVYQCDIPGIDADAKNLCKLGEKGEGYGNGGFYYTEESVDIANSVRKFIEDVSTAEIDPISAGTMAVPLDSLGGLRSRQFAYLPILEPIPNSPLLWKGNLKKYKVRNSTIVGSDNKFVFSNSAGLFARNTQDEWNTIINTSRPDTLRPDGGAPQIGGAYQKIFENATTPAAGNRNLFVDNGSSLTNLKVDASKKPVNFNGLSNYTNKQKLALLNFMGYSEPAATTVTDGAVLTSTKDNFLKNIGGVLHSIPQLITKKVAVDAAGRFDTSQRTDYLLYGSMDGALHMLDDSTGKEVFTFIPKQILDLQPDAISSRGTAKDGSYPYGVDGPWLTYVSYTNKSTTTGTGATATTINTYEADQSFALGGLRMGGSTYYALDVSDVTKPKMIYGIGSNYANRLMGDTTALSGIKGNVTGNASAEQKAFANMGQSWGKPAIGYVKSGGKRVMVSFLPGGYDTCYEDPTFKLSTNYPNNAKCSNKSTAQGNSVYMVQVGEVKTKTNNEEEVDISQNNGKLLWWANSEGTGSNSTSRSNLLQYSKATEMKHSVVTQIRTLDRNYDGLVDHIYYADLGGQVWRVDINNNADTDNFKVDRVVKILDVSDQSGTGDAPPRIYERPLITFYNGKYGYRDAANEVGSASGVQAMVTVGTGDRSNPVTATRSVPDALYNIIDKDVARSDLFFYGTGTAPTINLRTPTNKVAGTTSRNDKLQKLTFSTADINETGIKQRMESGAIQGWYMPFTTWLNETPQATGPYKMKMFNEPDALAGVLTSSSYNPDKGQAILSCSAGVKGATQRERTCLPFGACLDSTGNDVLTTRSTFNAGSGIVDNIVTQYNDTSIFSGLVNRCEGDSCKPDIIGTECVGPTCTVLDGFNSDKRINPLSWIEH